MRGVSNLKMPQLTDGLQCDHCPNIIKYSPVDDYDLSNWIVLHKRTEDDKDPFIVSEILCSSCRYEIK